MPTPEEHISLAEIVRTMKDFREEFRAAVGNMIRRDVYQAEQATLRAEIAASQAETKQQIAALASQVDELKAEKKQKNGIIYGAAISAVVAVILGFFNLK